MAIFTPRGLKLNLRTDEAFAYMARLYPNYKPFQILKFVEGMEIIPSGFAFIAGIICFFNEFNPYQIFASVGFSALFGGLIVLFALYFIPFMLQIFTLISYINGFGIFFISILVIGYFFNSWQGIVAFFVGRYSSALVVFVFKLILDKYKFKKYGLKYLSQSEYNFFNAYQILAIKIGKDSSLYLSDEEMNSNKWKNVLQEFAYEEPVIYNRFTE